MDVLFLHKKVLTGLENHLDQKGDQYPYCQSKKLVSIFPLSVGVRLSTKVHFFVEAAYAAKNL